MKYRFQHKTKPEAAVELVFENGFFRSLKFPINQPKSAEAFRFVARAIVPENSKETFENLAKLHFEPVKKKVLSDNKAAIWATVYESETKFKYKITPAEIGMLQSISEPAELFGKAARLFIAAEKTKANIRFFLVRQNEFFAAAAEAGKSGAKKLSKKSAAQLLQAEKRQKEREEQERKFRAAQAQITPEQKAKTDLMIKLLKDKLQAPK